MLLLTLVKLIESHSVNLPFINDCRRLLHYGVVEADRIYHLGSDGMNAGGVLGWYQAGYPFNGTYDVSRAFRSPNAVSRAQSASKYNAKDE